MTALEFVDAPPAPKHAKGALHLVTATHQSNGRLKLVTETGDRYVAPDSNRAHGTRAKYTIERCRCLDCTVAQRIYNRDRHRAMARPDEAFVVLVPAGPARRHLEELAAQGIGYKTVCKAVGAPTQTVRNLFWPRGRTGGGKQVPPARRIRPELERKILSFRPEMAFGAQRVDSTTFWAMYDQLRAQGFYRGWIAEQLGITSSNLRRAAAVRASTLRRMEVVFADWNGRPPPAKRSRWTQ